MYTLNKVLINGKYIIGASTERGWNNKVRVVEWAENQIVLAAKLRSNFQNQIAIARNCEKL